jgi:outer membrane protein OmpA-like peptidoglycan-associated protein
MTRSLQHEASPARGAKPDRPPPGAGTPIRSAPAMLRRVPGCACGGTCPRCQARSGVRIGDANDPAEREADAMAERVLTMPASVDVPPGPGAMLQRKCAACEREGEDEDGGLQRREASPTRSRGEDEFAPATVHEVLRSSGSPLTDDARAYFETRFRRDFSAVRVHTDGAAARSARDVNALAYTVGRDIVFAAGHFEPATQRGQRLLAHELSHVVQQGRAPAHAEAGGAGARSPAPAQAATMRSSPASTLQRAGDPAAIPAGLRCPTDLSTGRPTGTDIVFTVGLSTITAAHTAALTAFRDAWVAAGGTDDVVVHGYASTDGEQGANWTLSCDRAEAVQAELVRLGIPAVRISMLAHGESTDFSTSLAPNRRAVVTSSAPGLLPLPLVSGTLTARDNFAGRSVRRFGVGEVVDLDFISLPSRPATDFGGLEWRLVSGGGVLSAVTAAGTATYTAPAAAGPVQLDLRVAAGATAGRVVSTHAITIVIPSAVNITEVPGTAPNFMLAGGVATTVTAGMWGAGFQGNVFVDPKDVSFQGVVFGEGTVASVVTPAGSFLSPFAGLVHPANTFGAAHGGNAATGTPVSPPVDNITTGELAPAANPLGVPVCGRSDFLWAIPWEFSVAGGPRTGFAGGFTANHHMTSSFFCDASIEKAGAGPFVRSI